MLTELTGTLTFDGGATAPFSARITPRVEDGCRVYEARLPLFLDADGEVLLIASTHVDVLPPYSALALSLDRDAPSVRV